MGGRVFCASPAKGPERRQGKRHGNLDAISSTQVGPKAGSVHGPDGKGQPLATAWIFTGYMIRGSKYSVLEVNGE